MITCSHYSCVFPLKQDKEYRARRAKFSQVALDYRQYVQFRPRKRACLQAHPMTQCMHFTSFSCSFRIRFVLPCQSSGDPIPRVEYGKEDVNTWTAVWDKVLAFQATGFWWGESLGSGRF